MSAGFKSLRARTSNLHSDACAKDGRVQLEQLGSEQQVEELRQTIQSLVSETSKSLDRARANFDRVVRDPRCASLDSDDVQELEARLRHAVGRQLGLSVAASKFVKTWHQAGYPAVDPTELRAATARLLAFRAQVPQRSAFGERQLDLARRRAVWETLAPLGLLGAGLAGVLAAPGGVTVLAPVMLLTFLALTVGGRLLWTD